MLVLSRKVSERIMVDNGRIVITVVRIDGDKVRLGLEAQKDVKIDREEVFWAKEEQWR